MKLPDSIRDALKEVAKQHNLNYIELLESFFMFYLDMALRGTLVRVQDKSRRVGHIATILSMYLKSRGFHEEEE